MFILRVAIFATTLAFLTSDASAGRAFSCSFGEPACLDYGAVVCSSRAKCVDQSAACFDQFTCDFKGFVCKSKLDDVADEYDALVAKYNSLLDTGRTLAADFNRLKQIQQDMSACVTRASTLEEAQRCARY